MEGRASLSDEDPIEQTMKKQLSNRPIDIFE